MEGIIVKRSKAKVAGIKARDESKPITACRSKSTTYKREWRAGWREMDNALRAFHQEKYQ